MTIDQKIKLLRALRWEFILSNILALITFHKHIDTPLCFCHKQLNDWNSFRNLRYVLPELYENRTEKGLYWWNPEGDWFSVRMKAMSDTIKQLKQQLDENNKVK